MTEALSSNLDQCSLPPVGYHTKSTNCASKQAFLRWKVKVNFNETAGRNERGSLVWPPIFALELVNAER